MKYAIDVIHCLAQLDCLAILSKLLEIDYTKNNCFFKKQDTSIPLLSHGQKQESNREYQR